MSMQSFIRKIPLLECRSLFAKRFCSNYYKENNSKKNIGPISNLFSKYKYCRSFTYKKDVRYRTYTVENKSYLDKNFLSLKEWEATLCGQMASVDFSKAKFETLLVRDCLATNNLSLVDSYITYLEKNNENLNFAALSSYFMILGKNFNLVGEEKFRKVYDKLLEEKYLPHPVVVNIITALSFTNLYNEALDHINMLRETEKSVNLSYSHNVYIRALIKQKGLEDAYHYIIQIDRNEFYLDNNTIISLFEKLNLIREENVKDKQMEMLFHLLQEFEVSLPLNVADVAVKTFLSSWKISKMYIKNRGICNCCGASLNSVPMDQETVTEIKDVFETNAVIDSDIFKSTTPKEWEAFSDFLKKMAPFDVVIDGLNVLTGISVFQGEKMIKTLMKGKPDAKFLLVGRFHLKYKLKQIFPTDNRPPNLHYFFIDNMTQDDIFILYAALYSGLGTKIISKDFLRNYKFKMGDPVLQKKFLHWQKLHQILVFGRRNDSVIRLQEPYSYHRVPQWNADTQTWHVPIESENNKSYIEASKEWLCLQKRPLIIR